MQRLAKADFFIIVALIVDAISIKVSGQISPKPVVPSLYSDVREELAKEWRNTDDGGAVLCLSVLGHYVADSQTKWLDNLKDPEPELIKKKYEAAKAEGFLAYLLTIASAENPTIPGSDHPTDEECFQQAEKDIVTKYGLDPAGLCAVGGTGSLLDLFKLLDLYRPDLSSSAKAQAALTLERYRWVYKRDPSRLFKRIHVICSQPSVL